MVMHSAWLMARKDLTLHFGLKSTSMVQAVLLGLLLVFLFSLSLRVGETMTPQAASAIFWMASCFCQVLVFSALYAHEEINGQRKGLLLAPAPIQGVWLGKGLAGFCMLLTAQVIFFPATLVFLGQDIFPGWKYALLMLVAADAGMAALGSLLGALSQGQSSRDSLFSIILFPLLIPLLLAAIRVGTGAFSSMPTADIPGWFGTVLAFDAIFLAAGLLLFPYVFTADE